MNVLLITDYYEMYSMYLSNNKKWRCFYLSDAVPTFSIATLHFNALKFNLLLLRCIQKVFVNSYHWYGCVLTKNFSLMPAYGQVVRLTAREADVVGFVCKTSGRIRDSNHNRGIALKGCSYCDRAPAMRPLVTVCNSYSVDIIII